MEAGSLTPNPANWRKHPAHQVAALRESLADVGWAGALLYNERTKRLIDGHARRDGADPTELVPVLVGNWTPTQERRILATLDPLAGLAEPDPEALGKLLDGLTFDGEALAKLAADTLGNLDSGFVPVDIQTEAQPKVRRRVKPGDTWTLGDHRLVCGDCRRVCPVGRGTVDLAFTSPPYASQRKYDPSTGFRPIAPGKYVAWFRPVQKMVGKALKPTGSWCVNITEASEGGQKQTYVKRLILDHVDQWRWMWIDEFCWLRPALPLDPNRSRRFKNGWESVHHFAKTTDFSYYPDQVRHASAATFKYAAQSAAGKMIQGKAQGHGGSSMSPVGQTEGLAYPSNVLPSWGGAKLVGHAAAFPVDLPRFFILAMTQPGDLVLDPFVGSGTTILAAEREKRRCVGVEISPAFCDLAIERWQNLTGGKAKRVKR